MPTFEPLSAVSAVLPDNIRVFRRLTYGYRPQDLVELAALGSDFDERLQNYVNAQLAGYQPGYCVLPDTPGYVGLLVGMFRQINQESGQVIACCVLIEHMSDIFVIFIRSLI